MIETICSFCGKKIKKDDWHFNRAKNNFCSVKCKNDFQKKKNIFILKEDFAVLKIKEFDVFIDKEDIDKIKDFKWFLKYDKTINGYYVCSNMYQNNRRKKFYLHRFLMNTPKDLQCDHVNRKTIDNRKSNLRNVSLQENLENKGFYKNNKSGYKYIYWHKTNKNFVCEIKRNKKIVFRKTSKSLNKILECRDNFLKTINGGD